MAHETLEAYGNAKGMTPEEAHAYATENFGTLDFHHTELGAGVSTFGRAYTGEMYYEAVKPDRTRVPTRVTVGYPYGVSPWQKTALKNITKVQVMQ